MRTISSAFRPLVRRAPWVPPCPCGPWQVPQATVKYSSPWARLGVRAPGVARAFPAPPPPPPPPAAGATAPAPRGREPILPDSENSHRPSDRLEPARLVPPASTTTYC